MDSIDERIIDQLQNDFPLEQMPYAIIAARVGIAEDELFRRVEQMTADGLIRRLGFSLNSRKLGYSSTLAALKVGESMVQRAVEVINGFTEVTHNYLRDGQFNVWFTLVAADNCRIDEILTEIRARLGLGDSSLVNLPAERLFKLDARFKLGSDR